MHVLFVHRAFPAASLAVTQAGKLVALKSFGSFIYESTASEPGAPFLASSARSGAFPFTHGARSRQKHPARMQQFLKSPS